MSEPRSIPLKRVIQAIESGASVNAVDMPAEPGELGVLKTSCVYSGVFNARENKTVLHDERERVACPVRAGRLIVSRMNTPELVGAAGFTDKDYLDMYLPDRLWQVSFVESAIEPRFVYWWTQSASYRDQVRIACAGTSASMQNLDQDSFKQFSFPNVQKSVQRSIANFLDEQTARIDALIAEKERLLERLSEFWTSSVASAMAGADCESRVETHYSYYPTVPVRWRVVPFKHAVHFVEGPGILADDFRDEGVPLLRVSCVRSAAATLEGCNYLDPEKVAKKWSHFRVREGDLLISASASMGTVSLVTSETAGAIPYTGIIILRPIDDIAARSFIEHFVISDQFLRQIDSFKAGATIQHFGPTHLKQMVLALPFDLQEQRRVADRLTNVRSQHAKLEAHVSEHIDRLREYRSSLISAAVTGQLDIGTFRTQLPEAA